MKRSSNTTSSSAITEAVKTLVDVRASDTVYGDVYLRRARELLGTVLSQSEYSALKGIQADIDAAVKRIRVATASQEWGTVGDARCGGLTDLVSIDVADQRDSVIARFAVIRRARQVARWL